MRASTVFLAALVVAGCNESGSEPSAEPSSKASTSSPAGNPSAAPTANEKPLAAKKPMAKETSDTASDHLGKLPEGVGLKLGSPLPELKLQSSEGDEVDVNALAKTGTLMLVFYRGGWCPFCNYQIHSLAKAYPEFQKRGVTPVAISVDLPNEASKTQTSWKIPFPVLTDPELVAHKAFNVLNQLDDSGLAKLKGHGIDLEQRTGQKHHTIAIPSIFIINDGKVAWAHADTDYKTRPSTTQLLKVIDNLKL